MQEDFNEELNMRKQAFYDRVEDFLKKDSKLNSAIIIGFALIIITLALILVTRL